MQLQFHWMRPLSSVKKFFTLTEYLNRPLFLSHADSGENSLYLHDITMHQPIKSGHIIHLEAEHYVNQPLPSKALIELQWYLHRVTALTAAAFDDELELSDDEEDVDDLQ